MKTRNNREEVTLMFGRMYKEENKSISQIAKETNYSETTVRNYLSQGNYLPKRNTATKNKQIPCVDVGIVSIVTITKGNGSNWVDDTQSEEGKPYEELDPPFVLYKGKIYEKLTGERLRKALYNDLNIKKKRRGARRS